MTDSEGALILAIDTSTRAGSVAVGRADGTLVDSVQLDPARGHGSDLMLEIQRLVPEPTRLARVCVSRGPGSYTGLRVGIATAIGLAEGTGAELVGVPSLDALAHSAPPTDAAELSALRFAFGGQVYAARYALEDGRSPRVIEPATVIAVEDAAEWCSTSGAIVGDAKALELVTELDVPCSEAERPLAEAVLALGADLAAGDDGTGTNGAMPVYLRAFEAKNRRR